MRRLNQCTCLSLTLLHRRACSAAPAPISSPLPGTSRLCWMPQDQSAMCEAARLPCMATALPPPLLATLSNTSRLFQYSIFSTLITRVTCFIPTCITMSSQKPLYYPFVLILRKTALTIHHPSINARNPQQNKKQQPTCSTSRTHLQVLYISVPPGSSNLNPLLKRLSCSSHMISVC